jgi:Subtilase family
MTVGTLPSPVTAPQPVAAPQAVAPVAQQPVAQPVVDVVDAPEPPKPSNTGSSREHDSYNRQELLAYNPDPERLAALLADGYAVTGSVAVGDLGASVYRLSLPPGVTAEGARRRLTRRKPDIFLYNRTYRLFQAAGGRTASRPEPGSVKSGGPSCAGDHCFNRVAMGWSESLSACARSARIGILDTGADLRHPSFGGRGIRQASFVALGRDNAPSDHANSVLALLAGAPGSGTPGLVPDSTFFDAGVFGRDREGNPVADSFSILAGLEWLNLNGADIVNMSFAGPPDPLIEAALARMASRGVLLVAAAGNEGPLAPPSYPAAYPDVISVTAIGKDLRSYRHANRGDYIDVAAPGVGVWTAAGKATSGYQAGYQSGTSFAAPHMTAVLATLRRTGQVGKAAALKALSIADLGAPGKDPVYGRGLLIAPQGCRELSPDGTTRLAGAPADGSVFSWGATVAPAAGP